MNIINTTLQKSNNGISIALFRFLFGFIIFWETGRLVIWNNYIEYKYLNTVFNFKYPYFEWVGKLPDEQMIIAVWSCAILAIFFSFGILHKVVSPCIFIIYTYLELVDLSYWNNHYYFYSLILFLFIFIPPTITPSNIFKEKVSVNYNWHLYSIRAMVSLVLFFGGIAKLSNPDWINGLSSLFMLKNELTQKGFLLSETDLKLYSYLLTYGGLVFDLSMGILLWNAKLFKWLVLPFFMFNGINYYLFNIGSFPVTMICCLVLFLPNSLFKSYVQSNIKPALILQASTSNKISKYTIILFFSCQLVLPWRHLLIKGNCFWTSEGKLYSWHMMSSYMAYQAEHFTVVAIPQNQNKEQIFKLRFDNYLNKDQIRNMISFPTVTPQFATFVSNELTVNGYKEIKVYLDIKCSRNGRKIKNLIDPNIDLSKVNFSMFTHNKWILLYPEEGL